MKDIDEDEDEEEVVVLGDAGCAAMRAGEALWATGGRMEGMSSGRRLGAGGWGGPAVTWRTGGAIRSAAVGGEVRGCGLCLPGSAATGSCNA